MLVTNGEPGRLLDIIKAQGEIAAGDLDQHQAMQIIVNRVPELIGADGALIAAPESLPFALEVTARTPEGEIMAVRHRRHPTEGVQFHPESILTPDGPRLLANFLNGASHVAAA